jgi:hypothetical protein
MMNLGLMDPAFLGGLGGLSLYDPDAAAYIAAVEAADGQALETGVKDAINAFVLGCKADGIWNAIKASCILAGARTLAGALVPLVGAAPTNFNFVAGDYNRKTGLVGDGFSKGLSANRLINADPPISAHYSVYCTTTGSNVLLGAVSVSGDLSNQLFALSPTSGTFLSGRTVSIDNRVTGFIGASNTTASLIARAGGVNSNPVTSTIATTSSPRSYFVFARNLGGGPSSPTSSRLAFYSIGESLDLALLDARVTALVNALAVAIP